MAFRAVQTADVTACTKHDTLSATPGYILAAFTVGGFGLGRLVGGFRSHVREGIDNSQQLPSRPGVVLEVALVLFLGTAAVLLGYETWAVASGGAFPPITSYVRCAAYHQIVLASTTATFIAFMVSNWLWYPTK